MSQATKQQRRALRIGEVQERTGLSKSSIYALEAEKKFPRHFKLSERATGWFSDEVDAWLESRAARRSA